MMTHRVQVIINGIHLQRGIKCILFALEGLILRVIFTPHYRTIALNYFYRPVLTGNRPYPDTLPGQVSADLPPQVRRFHLRDWT